MKVCTPSTLLQLSIAGLLSIFSCVSGQIDEYPSKARDEFNSKHKYKPFKPTPQSRIKKIEYPNITLLRLQETGNPFTDVWEMSEHQSISDSIFFYANQEASKHRDNPRLFTELLMSKMDSISALDRYQSIAGVDIGLIVRIDSLNNKKAIIYHNSKYEDYMYSGYWLAYSVDNGLEWQYYYLGLSENQYIHFKGRQKIPLFLDDQTLQIECAIVRKTSPMILPTTPPEYELVEDNIIAQFDIEQIMLDSDGDGLTDIEEKRMLLDASRPDTDEDGIPDGIDSNPKNESKINKYTSLYKYLIDAPMNVNWMDSIVPFVPVLSKNPDQGYNQLNSNSLPDLSENELLHRADSLYRSNQLYIIATSDDHLFHLPKTLGRYIIISEKEYNRLKSSVFSPMENLSITPLFPVDDMPDHFTISVHGSFWSNDYLVIEKNDHWIIRIIGMMIV